MRVAAKEKFPTAEILKYFSESAEPLTCFQVCRGLKLFENFEIRDGVVMPFLHRLERLGVLSSSWVEVPHGTGTRKRMVYTITEKGRAGLASGRDPVEAARNRAAACLFILLIGAVLAVLRQFHFLPW